MDSRNFLINQPNANRSEYLAFFKIPQTFNTFIRDLIRGDIGGYKLSDFFTENSDYVTRVVYYPFDISKFFYGGTTNVNLAIGKKEYNKYNLVQPNAIIPWTMFRTTIYRKFNNFLDFEPYTHISLYVPFFDVINLNPEKVYNKDLWCNLSIDAWNGKVACSIYLDGKNLIYYNEKQIGIEISLGKSNAQEQERNAILQSISALGSAIGVAVGVYAGNPLITAGSVGLATKTVTSAMANSVFHISGYNGATGNRNQLTLDKEVKLIFEYPKNVTRPEPHLRGKVLDETVPLNTISGYTEVSEIHFNPFDTIITDKEINEIVELLRTGVIL